MHYRNKNLHYRNTKLALQKQKLTLQKEETCTTEKNLHFRNKKFTLPKHKTYTTETQNLQKHKTYITETDQIFCNGKSWTYKSVLSKSLTELTTLADIPEVLPVSQSLLLPSNLPLLIPVILYQIFLRINLIKKRHKISDYINWTVMSIILYLPSA